MVNSLFSKLRNGSDIRGVASGENIELTNEVVEKISYAFIIWLSDKYAIKPENITLAVGHDSRNSALRIKNVVINTVRTFGCGVYDCSFCSTPAMFMAISTLKCTASIEITASHLPPEKNGLKFFTSEGGISFEDVDNILKIAERITENLPKLSGNVRSINLMGYYTERLKNIIKTSLSLNSETPLKGMKIVVDAGGGVGGFFAKDVLEPLGADIEGSIGLKPDGDFPIHIPNPENEEALRYACEATRFSRADMGIIFDTDVDRVAIIDNEGETISGTKLIALVSDDLLKNNPKSVIVTDSMTYESLKSFIEKRGGYQFRYKRGYNNVITMAKKINENGGNCQLAIETSGHAAFKENDFIDDGAYLACKMVVEAVKSKFESKTFKDKINDLDIPTGEVNLRLKINDKAADIKKLMKDLKSLASSNKNLKLDENNFEGIRIHFPSKHQRGWLLLRESIHEPILVLHIESYAVDGLRSIIGFMKPFFKKYKFLDISNL